MGFEVLTESEYELVKERPKVFTGMATGSARGVTTDGWKLLTVHAARSQGINTVFGLKRAVAVLSGTLLMLEMDKAAVERFASSNFGLLLRGFGEIKFREKKSLKDTNDVEEKLRLVQQQLKSHTDEVLRLRQAELELEDARQQALSQQVPVGGIQLSSQGAGTLGSEVSGGGVSATLATGSGAEASGSATMTTTTGGASTSTTTTAPVSGSGGDGSIVTVTASGGGSGGATTSTTSTIKTLLQAPRLVVPASAGVGLTPSSLEEGAPTITVEGSTSSSAEDHPFQDALSPATFEFWRAVEDEEGNTDEEAPMETSAGGEGAGSGDPSQS